VRPADLLKNLPQQYLEESGWLPLEENRDGLLVLTIDPDRVTQSHIVNQVFPRLHVIYRVTTRAEFAQTLAQFFGGGDSASVGELLSGMGSDGEDESDAPQQVSEAVENELVKLLNKIIVDAHRQGASDIHIEPLPGKGKTGIRFRKDGVLVPYIEVPAAYRAAMVARIKIMCDLDISERRKPQDGKIKFKKYGPLDIELRVATIPSAGGVEDVVMRILAAGEPIPLDKLGVLPANLDRLRATVEKPYGLFFVCGPTGSGKTTTLHSVLSYLNTPETKIWTAEDPVEITQKGLRQVQVNRKAGLEFATVMRAFLRADPDIIMVGEMRDKETVSMGIEASLTGHLVFSTLHTNSAPIAGHGHGPVQFRRRPARHPGAAPGQAPVRQLQAALPSGRSGARPAAVRILRGTAEHRHLPARCPGRAPAGVGAMARALRRCGRPFHPVPAARLRTMQQGLPRPRRPARADDRHRPRQEAAAGARPRRPIAGGRAGRRHADLENGRH
jgi:type II secretory ATPase GspE/PulE/Tfp pilus assembly ATPase PilB-like protein